MPFVLLALFGLVAFSQQVEIHAPWLTVYDTEGRPRWEVTLEKLSRTDSGWEGEGVKVRLYWEGELRFELEASRLTADGMGRTWTLTGDISGQAGGLVLACEKVSWCDGLSAEGLVAQGDDLVLEAAQASWKEGDQVILTEVHARSGGWEVRLPQATYFLDSGVLSGEEADLVGHGYEIHARLLRFFTKEGRLELEEARVVARP